jgi:hypothetical protein
MDIKRAKSLIKKGFTDDKGNVVIWQAPNIPLWGWFIFLVLSMIFSKGILHTASKYISLVFLVIWAILEIVKGASIFRRILGVVVLVLSIVSRLKG